MKSSSPYTRTAKPIKGADVAAAPRSHALDAATENTKRINPQRSDLLRRHMLSTRRDKTQN
jgi:hypothetical protein